MTAVNKTAGELRERLRQIAIETRRPSLDLEGGAATAEQRVRYEASLKAQHVWRQQNPSAAAEYDQVSAELLELDRARGETLLEHDRQLTKEAQALASRLLPTKRGAD